MPLPANELARRDARGLLLAPAPVRVTWTLEDLPAADGHALRCRVSAGVRPVNEPAELRMLQDVLMGPRPALTAEDVARYFAPTLREAGVATAKDKGVESWLAGGEKDAFARALKAAADRAAFACGLELLPPFQVDLESPTFEQKRLKDLQRALAEQEAAGRVEHFNRAADLLKRFEEIRERAPELTPGAILNQLSPVDQGATLQSLLLASARQQPAKNLWAVGGEYLVRIDARDASAGGSAGGAASPAVELFPLPPTLGPLRSVQAAQVDGERLLLVGARDGFYLVRPDDPATPRRTRTTAWIPHSGSAGSCSTTATAGSRPATATPAWSGGRTQHDHGPSGVLRPERFGGLAAAGANGGAAP
jgi:hypothetical protein